MRADGRGAPACSGCVPPVARTPANWQAPPVSTMRLPAARVRPELSSRSFTSSKVSSMRGRMMLTTMLRGTFGDLMLLLADQRHRQHVAFIVRAGFCTLPYSVFNRSACATGVDSSRARSFVTCAPPTGICAVCINWSSEEQRHAGGAAAHVDDGCAEFALVVHQRRQVRRPSAPKPVRRSRDRSARCRRRGNAARWRKRRSHAAAQSVVAEQATRIGDVIRVVQREGQRHRMDRLAAFGGGARCGPRSPHRGCRDLPPRARRPAISH